ncbi:Two-component sensor histidine kinase, contains HisKA and HATPase domains [Mucilaginibacter gossypiicola]|uniref:histidine kinase n=1 Tax=Mucilaginibacter gossypiicola TaxID=551995 RepID=A0A1H8RCJ4_9SPHI|nr:histidine kinase dimerization/phosphoacceptor domain -containing protein [Mucilaginibacter gossypiicola]SEO64249.1 Two-component sensor histidine kinase, contains HisKA and HATPase domains [Mucilaginibacter gossypiicola]
MKFKLLLLCFAALFITGNINAQSSTTLLTQVQKSKADTGKVKLLLALSRTILLKSGAGPKEIDSSYRFMKQAEQLSVQLNDIKGQGHTALMAAMISNKKGDHKAGADIAQKGFDLFKSIDDQPGMAEAYIIIGQHYTNDGADLDKKMAYYKKAIDIFLKLGITERAATTMTDLGDLLTLQGKYEESVKNLRAALNLYNSIGFKDLQGLYDLLGTDLTYLGDADNALKYELMAIRLAEGHRDTSLQMCTIYNRLALSYYTLRKWDQALIYFDKAIAVAKKYKDSVSIVVITGNEAMAYYKLEQPVAALSKLKILNNYASLINNPDKKIEMYYVYCLVYIQLKQYKMAKVYLDKLDLLAKDAGNQITEIYRGHISYHVATGEYKKAYAYLQKNEDALKDGKLLPFLAQNQLYWFKADSGLGKYASAIKHYQRYKMLVDSNYRFANNKHTAFLQIEFETEKKNNDLQLQAKDIQLLKNTEQLQRSQVLAAQTSRNMFIGGSCMLALLLAVGYNRYRLKQHVNMKLQVQQDEINKQNHALQQLNSKQEGLLTEKEWLLKEVHHRVKNNLQIVMSLLSTQSAYLENNAAALEAITGSQNRVSAIALIHHKLYSSSNVAAIKMPTYVADLVDNLRDCFDTGKRRIRFELLIDPIELDLTQAVPFGLILNEAITNAIKYAFQDGGGIINIGLHRSNNNSVLLTIADNGKGLPENFDLRKATSLGMEMMKALSKQLGGSFTIKGLAGVTIAIEFQIEELRRKTTLESD